MNELVGVCDHCEKELFCMDGFFHAEIDASGKLYCLSCFKEIKKEYDVK